MIGTMKYRIMKNNDLGIRAFILECMSDKGRAVEWREVLRPYSRHLKTVMYEFLQ